MMRAPRISRAAIVARESNARAALLLVIDRDGALVTTYADRGTDREIVEALRTAILSSDLLVGALARLPLDRLPPTSGDQR